jgi:ATP-dependent DNA helicase RecQ
MSDWQLQQGKPAEAAEPSEFFALAGRLQTLLDVPGVDVDDLDRRLVRLRRLAREVTPPERPRARSEGKRLSQLVKAAREAAPPIDWTGKMQGALELLGLTEFRSGQAEVIESVLGRRDALVVIPTGGGKSLTYQVPSVVRKSLTVVISPLIALMEDQRRRMEEFGAFMLASTQSEAEREESLQALRSGRAHILLVAPERLASKSFVQALCERDIDLVVVDEAHCVSEMGHDFRPDYLRLSQVLVELGRPPVLALTATATPQIAREITKRLQLRDPYVHYGGFDRPNISFDVVTLGGEGSMRRKDLILQEGLALPGMTPAIVYCGSRKDTDRLAEMLAQAGHRSGAYHAGLDASVRGDVQAKFMDGELDVVTATNAFGMGVDKADVRSVWHHALPSSMEAYYQEAGRGGRDGAPARAILLAMRADLGRLVGFNKKRLIEMHEVDRLIARLVRSGQGSNSFTIAAGDDRDRIIIGILERVGLLLIDRASRESIEGRLRGESLDPEQRHQAQQAIARTVEMGWAAFRSIERYMAEDEVCRRQQILDHFSDHRSPTPIVRCCDVHEAPNWLEQITPAVDEAMRSRPARKRSSSSSGSATRAPGASTAFEDIAGDVDAGLLDALRTWRSDRSGTKPAYTVCKNETLAQIARVRPSSEDELLAINGIGPGFIDKHASSLLELLSTS